jgi:hypothetical protein
MKKTLLIILVLVVIALGGGALYWGMNMRSTSIVSDKNNEIKNTTMATTDSQVQDIVKQYKDLRETLSPEAKQRKKYSSEDFVILKQMSDLGLKLKALDSKEKIQAFVSANISDNTISITINGKDIGIEDETLGTNEEGDTVTGLRNADSLMKLISVAPEQVFILNKGENIIRVSYKNKKLGTPLRVKVRAYADFDTVLSIDSRLPEGVVEKSFTLNSVKPADFAPVLIQQ